MTTEKKPKVLFMDDEFAKEDPPALLLEAKRAMENAGPAGMEVVTVSTLDEAAECFYRDFYSVFVLDIDMKAGLGSFSVPGCDEPRGTNLAAVYKGLDNECAVVLYSGAATPADKFAAANAHVYALVEKNPGSEQELAETVAEAVLAIGGRLRIPTPCKEGTVLLVQTDPPVLSPATVSALAAALGQAFTVEPCGFEQVEASTRLGDYAAIVAAAEEFMWETAAPLGRFTPLQPNTHTVLVCGDQNTGSLTNAVNARPFRLVNLFAQTCAEDLIQAVLAALRCRGGWETLRVESSHVERAAHEIDWAALQEALMDDPLDDFGDGDEEESVEDEGGNA